uniref:N-acetyltransferase domain-containing protein n=1 Tax=Timspurckia oligopyrenoides TaxID=708627 RepID=A0A7S1ESB5_9RHOD|mmetsp:Transcript_3831/g.6694  ORF Transcript_3831/g.6694 Transcript_3831/m.6694 type:complete len:487 (+) Transcript_3831:19-1479(+)
MMKIIPLVHSDAQKLSLALVAGSYSAVTDELWKCIRSLRESVFIKEQGFHKEIEFDSIDMNPQCIHVLAIDHELYKKSNQIDAVAVARFFPSSLSEEETEELNTDQPMSLNLGRVAVVKTKRGLGIGSRVIETIISSIQSFFPAAERVQIHAQLSSEQFYIKLGFIRQDIPMDIHGVAHVKMELRLNKNLLTYSSLSMDSTAAESIDWTLPVPSIQVLTFACTKSTSSSMSSSQRLNSSSKLKPKDILQLSNVCNSWRTVIQSHHLFKEYLETVLPLSNAILKDRAELFGWKYTAHEIIRILARCPNYSRVEKMERIFEAMQHFSVSKSSGNGSVLTDLVFSLWLNPVKPQYTCSSQVEFEPETFFESRILERLAGVGYFEWLRNHFMQNSARFYSDDEEFSGEAELRSVWTRMMKDRSVMEFMADSNAFGSVFPGTRGVMDLRIRDILEEDASGSIYATVPKGIPSKHWWWITCDPRFGLPGPAC